MIYSRGEYLKRKLDIKSGMLKSNFIIRNYCKGTGEDTLLISWKHVSLAYIHKTMYTYTCVESRVVLEGENWRHYSIEEELAA